MQSRIKNGLGLKSDLPAAVNFKGKPPCQSSENGNFLRALELKLQGIDLTGQGTIFVVLEGLKIV